MKKVNVGNLKVSCQQTYGTALPVVTHPILSKPHILLGRIGIWSESFSARECLSSAPKKAMDLHGHDS